MQDQPQGPSRETLRKLAGMLPSLKKAMIERRAIGKGKPAPRSRPTKVCTVCGVLHDHKLRPQGDETPITHQPCPACEGNLKQGYTALVHGNDYAFVMIKDCSNYAGAIMHIPASDMAELKAKIMLHKCPPDEEDHPQPS